MSFPHYYQTELAYYRSLLQEYARRHPEVGHIVGERNADPAVERLLQGASLLTARTRFQVEDDLPPLIQSLFLRMWPQFMQPLPAVTMIQLLPGQGLLGTTTRIPAGMPVQARPLEGSLPLQAYFRTTGPIDVMPISLTSATIDRLHPADLLLRLRFTMIGGATLGSAKIRTLRLHLFGDHETRFGLYYWLTRCCRQVTILGEQEKRRLVVRDQPVRPAGFEPDSALIPFLDAPNPGFRILQEYFALPDKFIAVDVCGLEKLPIRPDNMMEVIFHLGKPDLDHFPVSTEAFAIGCGPAVNALPAEKIELTLEPGATSARLMPTRGGQILQVARVGCYRRESREWIEFTPYFAPGRLRLLEDRPCYQTLRLTDGVEQTIRIQITTPDGTPTTPPADRIICWVEQSEGHLVTRIPLGQVDQLTAASPEHLTIKNPTRVLPPEPLRVEQDRRWDLLAQLAMHPNDLASANGLNQLLQSFALDRTGHVPEITQVKSTISALLHKRTMVPVKLILVDVDETHLEHVGQLVLFAEVINQLFRKSFDSNIFNQITVRGQKSGRLLLFNPQ